MLRTAHHTQHQHQRPATPVPGKAEAKVDLRAAGFIPSPDEVARRAHFAYANEGSPPGRDVQHWLEAERQLIEERRLTRTHGFHNPT